MKHCIRTCCKPKVDILTYSVHTPSQRELCSVFMSVVNRIPGVIGFRMKTVVWQTCWHAGDVCSCLCVCVCAHMTTFLFIFVCVLGGDMHTCLVMPLCVREHMCLYVCVFDHASVYVCVHV